MVVVSARSRRPLIERIAPGLALLRGYRREWLGYDLVAGLSVAAVALPTAIAYAQLAGFPPVVGLYASILPLVAYAVFGTSRQLVVNPDAATCAMIAAMVGPLAGGDQAVYVSLSVTLAFLTGIACIAAGFFRFGFLADFLARPVLVGFLNGIAIGIFLGQIGKLFGFAVEAGGIIPRIVEIASKLPQTHWPTLAVGAATLAALYAVNRYAPRWPGPLLALVGAIAVSALLSLEGYGVAVVGAVPAGMPELSIPRFDPELLPDLFIDAIGLALVSFSSGMVTARSFAARNRYEIDVDREFVAIGACNIAAGLSQGFAVAGADSRTAVADVMGGKSQVTGLVAAAVMGLVLLFLTGPLQHLPVSALGAVLIVAALGLFDLSALKRLHRIREGELLIALVTMFGVVVFGVLQGIIFAVGLALLLLLIRTSRPPEAVLGRIAGQKGFHNVARHADATTVSGLVLYRFGSAVIFFNAPYLKQRVLQIVDTTPGIEWFVLDGGPVTFLDSTGADTLASIADALTERGIRFAIAEAHFQARQMLDKSGALSSFGPDALFPTLKSAVKAYRSAQRAPGDDAPPPEPEA